MSSISESLKKLKNSEENKEVLHNYSSILSSCFIQEGSSLKSFFYSFKSFPLFGILLPIDLSLCVHLEFIQIYNIEIETQSQLRKFQHELWSDLLKTSKDPIGRVSEANYFVVPLAKGKIDWEIIYKALGEQALGKLSEVKSQKEEENSKLVLKTGIKGQALWKYVNEVKGNSNISQFFDLLFMADLAKAKENKEKYAGYDSNDVVFDEKFYNPATKDLRNLIVSKVIPELNDETCFVFVKQLKSIRTNDSEVLNKNTKGVPFLPSQCFDVFYLNIEQWEQARGVFFTLIEIEEFSWLLEFIQRFEVSGNSVLLKASMSCYNEKTRKVFENLEILGGVSCNFIIGLSVFLEEFSRFEGKSVEKIIKALVGPENCEKISKKFELFSYLKTACIKASSFRPAFYASKETITECYNLEHKISDGLAAGFIRALTGALVLSNGLQYTSEFLFKLGIISDTQLSKLQKYLNNDNFSIVNIKTMPKISIIPKISEIFKSIQKTSIETILDYNFSDPTLLYKSLSLNLFNQKLVKFLGKCLIDLILSYNLLTYLEFDTSLYLYLFQELRSSFNISRLTLSSSLYLFLQQDSENKGKFDSVFIDKSWDEHLFKTSGTLPASLEYFFYNLSVAVLLDSSSFALFSQVIGYFFIDLISISLRFRSRIKKTLNGKIADIIKSSPVKVEFKEIENSTGACVKVFIGKELVCESTARNIKQAKVEACLNAFQFICMCNLIHYNKPLLVID